MDIHPRLVLVAWAAASLGAGAFALGCIDAHHLEPHHAEHHEDHHEIHHDDHHVYYPVVNARPAPPSQPPAQGPGHWVWDDTRQQYIWVSERAQP